MPREQLARYLDLLGIRRRPPGLAALRELVRAHLTRVPFENISKLYYRKHLGLHGLPGLERFLDGIDRFHFGGTCYTNNFYCYQLLANLGYEVMLCGAAMVEPDVHLVSLVRVAGREYLVDVGYAAPFLAPLPCDRNDDHVLVLGRDRYVLKPRDDRGRTRMELYRDGALRHAYVVKPVPREIGEFEAVIAASFRPESTFMKALLLARFFPDRSLVIHNLSVIESRGERATVRRLSDRNELAAAVEDGFGIPAEITADVVKELAEFGDAWR
jgi:arylamine N-acetyltransferase